MYTSKYAHITCMHICIHACIHIFTYACRHICIYAMHPLELCMHTKYTYTSTAGHPIDIRTYIRFLTHGCTGIRTHTLHTRCNIDVWACIHTYVRTNTTNIHAYVRCNITTYAYRCIHTYMHTTKFVDVYKHKHTSHRQYCRHTHMPTYYVCIYIYIYIYVGDNAYL